MAFANVLSTGHAVAKERKVRKRGWVPAALPSSSRSSRSTNISCSYSDIGVRVGDGASSSAAKEAFAVAVCSVLVCWFCFAAFGVASDAAGSAAAATLLGATARPPASEQTAVASLEATAPRICSFRPL